MSAEASGIRERRRRPRIEAGMMSQTEPSDSDGADPAPPADGGRPNVVLEAEKPWEQRAQSFKVRAFWAFALIFGFMLIIAAGHFYCSLLVILITVGIFREIISLKRNVEKEHHLPLFYALRWYFFTLTIIISYRRFLSEPLENLALKYRVVEVGLRYHSIFAYGLICVGFIGFVLSLRKFTLRYQFQQLSWTVVTLVLVVVQCMAQIANIYSGLIWFLLPTSMVIVNDCMAYIFGFFFGRTKLIKLSPKKTWEGFIGGSLATMAWSVFIAWFLQQFPYFRCPQQVIVFKPFEWNKHHCTLESSAIFKQETVDLFGMAFTLSGLQKHALILGIFASLVAPFGGFFASGFKRAFKIKDFGDSIPGHGGITDRFDCQVIMGMFTYIYCTTYVAHSLMSPEVLASWAAKMTIDDQKTLLGLVEENIRLH